MSQRIEVYPEARDESGALAVPIAIGQGPSSRTIYLRLELSAEQLAAQLSEPVPVKEVSGAWVYRNRIVKVFGDAETSPELIVRIKHRVLAEQRAVERIRRDVEAFENFERLLSFRRESIPADVQMFVS